MIVLGCAAVVSVGAGIFLAVKDAARKPARIKRVSANKASLVDEVGKLSDLLVKELSRMEKQAPAERDLHMVVSGVKKLVTSAWNLKSYYGERHVSSFLKVLDIAVEMQSSSPVSDSLLKTLKGCIPSIARECSEMILRDEDGDNVNDTTYNANQRYDDRVTSLNRHIQDVIDRRNQNELTG